MNPKQTMELRTAKITIRPMREDDIEGVQNIDKLSFSLPWPERAYRYELKENRASLLWVAEAEDLDGTGELVGMAVVWLILDEAHIATIAVHPDYRHQGIGERLLFTTLEGSARRGAQQAMLEVRASNQIARNLYQRFGFVVVGRRPHYYRDNSEDAVLMNLHGLGPDYLDQMRRLVVEEG
jgi:ribosomal-protein-alanine N-acetyltransferase